MFIEMTGMRAGYRQRGISLAMKVLAIRFARAGGAVSIHTFHSHENSTAVRANEKLRLRPGSQDLQPCWRRRRRGQHFCPQPKLDCAPFNCVQY